MGFSGQPPVVCLAFELPNRQPQERQLVLVQLSLESIAKTQHTCQQLGASAEGALPEGRQKPKWHRCLQNPPDRMAWTVTKGTLRTKVQTEELWWVTPQNSPPRGTPKSFRSHSCKPGHFSVGASSLRALLLDLLRLQSLVSSDNCVTRMAAWR